MIVVDRIDWTAILNVLKMCGVGESLMNGMKTFYKDKWRNELEFWNTKECETGMCAFPMSV